MAEHEPNRRSLLRRAFATLCAALFGCQGPSDQPQRVEALHSTHQARIQAALAGMLQRRTDDGFVIVEDRDSAKFVQFFGAEHDDLLIDLPFQALNAAETARARAFFLRLGIQASENELLDRPGGQLVGRQCTFQMRSGRDAAAAADVAVGIFEQVYQLPVNFELVIREN
jgi:hypothetical protein